MRILAIDPGPRDSAYLVFNDEASIILFVGFIPNKELLNDILSKRFLGCDLMAIESIEGFGVPAGQDTFDTCFWSGRFVEAFNSKFVRLSRKKIKIHFCGHSSAKDSHIRQALVHRYGDPDKNKQSGMLAGITGHLWSALAVAVYTNDNLATLMWEESANA